MLVFGPLTSDGQPPILLKELAAPSSVEGEADSLNTDPNSAKKKIIRKPKKKGIIEDTYPMYLQVRLVYILSPAGN